MKTGRSMQSLALELDRQQRAKKDLVLSSSLLRHQTNERGETWLLIPEATGEQRYGVTALACRQLAEKLHIPCEKMPSNVVEHFGNSSGVTIPLALAFNLRERVCRETLTAVFGGFGVGLTWSSLLMPLGPLAFCEMIDYPQVN